MVRWWLGIKVWTNRRPLGVSWSDDEMVTWDNGIDKPQGVSQSDGDLE